MERDPDIARCQKPGMVHECHMAPEVGSMFFFFFCGFGGEVDRWWFQTLDGGFEYYTPWKTNG